jgi:membrane protease subunit HflC
MNQRTLILAAGLLIVGLFTVTRTFFILPQYQQALVTQFGNPVRVVREPGLQVKIPFMQDVRFYDKMLLEVDPPTQEVILGDQKRITVDAYSRYRITDPLAFYQNVRDEVGAQSRIAPIINTSIRRVLGAAQMSTILSNGREALMAEIQKEVDERAKDYGVEIIDVRLRRADLPDQTSAAVFQRMRSERDREAKELRAQGQELAQQIRSRADRDRTVIIATAQSEAQSTRGEGEAKAVQVYADAFGQDPQFFAFYRSMQAYRTALGQGDSTLVLSPDSSFFRFFNAPNAEALPAAK